MTKGRALRVRMLRTRLRPGRACLPLHPVEGVDVQAVLVPLQGDHDREATAASAAATTITKNTSTWPSSVRGPG